MKRKYSMSSETTIHDLPNEMLEHVLSFLSFDDREAALQACRRWSELKPFNHWSSLQLVVDFTKRSNYHRTLLASRREYKHLVFRFGNNFDKYVLIVDIVRHFHRTMETLKLIQLKDYYDSVKVVELNTFARIMALCSHLRCLFIDMCDIDHNSGDLELPSMNNLVELYLGNNLLSLVPHLKDIMPNITKLHMQIETEDDLSFLRHFSLRLVELEIWFCSEERFVKVCRMQFPLLEKVKFRGAPMGSYMDYPGDETLRCSASDRRVQNLCRTCVNIKFLCLSLEWIMEDCFRVICELKHLRHLRLEDSGLVVPMKGYTPLESLEILTLKTAYIDDQDSFSEFVQKAFPNILVVEMLDMDDINGNNSLNLFYNVCSDIPSLQRLVINEFGCSSISLEEFLDLCAMRELQEVRLKCGYLSGDDEDPEDEIPPEISVQKLILDMRIISLEELRKLVGSMSELRWLELRKTRSCSSEVISSLRKDFPRCWVEVKRKVSIIVGSNICANNLSSTLSE